MANEHNPGQDHTKTVTIYVNGTAYPVEMGKISYEQLLTLIKAPALPERKSGAKASAEIPTPRSDPNSMLAHRQLVEKAKKGGIDVYFVGNSIVRRWGASDPQYAPLLANWNKNFFGWNAGNFGWGADRTQNILWRIENGELDSVNPRVVVLLAGTNNIASGATAIVGQYRAITRQNLDNGSGPRCSANAEAVGGALTGLELEQMRRGQCGRC